MNDDTISRAAAIDAICEDGTQRERQGQYSMTMVDRKYRDTEILEGLPSAQSEYVHGRNINVDELIKILNPESNYVFYDDAHGFCINTQDVLDHLCAMPPAQPWWIPVTEKLPKPNEYENDVRVYYLVQNEYGDMMVCSWHGSYWTRMYRSTKVKDKVVAWMPLPKPWEGGQ